MRAELIPVGADGLHPEAAVRIETLSYNELAFQNAQLIDALSKAKLDAAAAHDKRIEAQTRLNRSLRVLASLGRHSPQMAAHVEAARREVYGRLP